ncbi:hypothetical protein SSS_06356, partial [Sarcoptes scabiei]
VFSKPDPIYRLIVEVVWFVCLSEAIMRLFWLSMLTIMIVAVISIDAVGNRQPQQQQKRLRRQTSQESQTTALAIQTTNVMITFTNIVLPTIRAIIQTPIKLLHQLFLELRHFLNSRNLSDLMDTKFIGSLAERIPDRARHYWFSFVELESECIQRTLCDMADFTAHHLPHWGKQIMLIYFTTFTPNKYFEAINNGLIAHNCQAKFTQCDPNSFLSRISNNMTQSIHSTVSPIRVAFNELVNATVSTLDTLAKKKPDLLINESNVQDDLEDEMNDDDEEQSDIDERSGRKKSSSVNQNQQSPPPPQSPAVANPVSFAVASEQESLAHPEYSQSAPISPVLVSQPIAPIQQPDDRWTRRSTSLSTSASSSALFYQSSSS